MYSHYSNTAKRVYYMYFAEFYTKGAVSDALVQACGDRSVFILDGRNSLRTMQSDANEWAVRHNFDAYMLRRGAAISRARAITQVISTVPHSAAIG